MSNIYMGYLTQEDKNKLILEKEEQLKISKSELKSLFESNHTPSNPKLNFITDNTKIIDEKDVLSNKSNIEKINSAYIKQKDDMEKNLHEIVSNKDLETKEFPYLDMIKIDEKKDHITVSIWFNSEENHKRGVITSYQVYIVNMYIYEDDKVKYDYSIN